MARKAAAEKPPVAKKPKRTLEDLESVEALPDSKSKLFVSTGLTILNLALNDDPFKGWRMGSYYNIIGHSSSGKTFLALTCLAEMAISPLFNGYRLFHDDPEDGALMDKAKFFGEDAAKRIKEPRLLPDKLRTSSETIEDFYDNLHHKTESGVPFGYVLDSNDALSSEAEQDKDEEQRKARAADKDAKGSYGDSKAKYHSSHLRQACIKLQKAESLLIVLSQTRENFDPMAMEKYVRSGGRALKFYSQVEMWLSPVKSIQKTVNGKPRVIGGITEINIKKNRHNGKPRKIRFYFYFETGIDDVTTNVEWLIDEGFWSCTENGPLSAPDFEFEGKKRDFIRTIEAENRRDELAAVVAQRWAELEAKIANGRTSKYARA
jgi:RecA/RadA recombinase